MPTIGVLQGLDLFKTLHGLILVEVAGGCRRSVCLLFCAFVATIPKELDEAATIDGAEAAQAVFPRSCLPLLPRPGDRHGGGGLPDGRDQLANDFTNPLYYLLGRQNVTVQLTLYNFQSQFDTSYNLLFMDILLVTIPPLIMFLFFNRQIVAGLTAVRREGLGASLEDDAGGGAIGAGHGDARPLAGRGRRLFHCCSMPSPSSAAGSSTRQPSTTTGCRGKCGAPRALSASG